MHVTLGHGHGISVSGDGFSLSDRGIVEAISKLSGGAWGSQFGDHVGAASSIDLHGLDRPSLSLASGTQGTLELGSTTFSYSARLAADPSAWHPLAYVETLESTVQLPHRLGVLTYGITLEIEPLPRTRAPAPVRVSRWALEAGASVVAVVLARQAMALIRGAAPLPGTNLVFGAVGGEH